MINETTDFYTINVNGEVYTTNISNIDFSSNVSCSTGKVEYEAVCGKMSTMFFSLKATQHCVFINL